MPITILIVDNEKSIRKMLRVVLKGSKDTDFLEAKDGTEALKIAREHRGPIHLVLSDVVMPGKMTGIEMAAQLSQARPEMKVVLMSGYDSVALKMEPDWHFIQKPFSVSEIQERIGNILSENYLAANRSRLRRHMKLSRLESFPQFNESDSSIFRLGPDDLRGGGSTSIPGTPPSPLHGTSDRL
jgi:DNA-binding NtrC family response regulator